MEKLTKSTSQAKEAKPDAPEPEVEPEQEAAATQVDNDMQISKFDKIADWADQFWDDLYIFICNYYYLRWPLINLLR